MGPGLFPTRWWVGGNRGKRVVGVVANRTTVELRKPPLVKEKHGEISLDQRQVHIAIEETLECEPWPFPTA